MTKHPHFSEIENDRRLDKRRQVLDTFSLFIVVPKKGLHRLNLSNVSKKGLFFDFDIEGETPEDPGIEVGEKLDIRFYLNLSLHIELQIEVKRIKPNAYGRQIGAEISNLDSKEYQAYLALLHLLDQIVEIEE